MHLNYRFSEGQDDDPNDWRPLADEARFITKPMRRTRIPRDHFDPDSLFVGTIELAGISETAAREIVDPQTDVTLDLTYTDPESGIAGISLNGLKVGALSRVGHAGTSGPTEVFQAHCQCRRA